MSPQEREREALSDDALLDILRRLNLSGCKSVPLTRTVGPYEITEPTFVVRVLADAIWQACAAPKDARIEELERRLQFYIGAKARREIELSIVRDLLEDPDFETSAMDMEYWDDLHDKLRDVLSQLSATQAELAAVREDAERYRAIRNDAINPMCMFAAKVDDDRMVGVESMKTGAELDAAIDAERAARKETE